MSNAHFSSALPIVVFTRDANEIKGDWIEQDRGPGFFTLPVGHQALVRARQIDDMDLRSLINDLLEIRAVIGLDLAENRKVTDRGLEFLTALKQLSILNLSSCDITNIGLSHLKRLPRLTHLDISYCNRLTENALKPLNALTNLKELNIKGLISIKTAGYRKLERRGLTIIR